MSASPKESVALRSIMASAFMTVTKLAVGFLTGSLGVLAEGVHSLLDLGATVMTYFAVRIGDRPPDEEHPYGHAKVESVAALAETGLLFLTSAWIIYEVVHRLLAADHEVAVTWWSIGVILLAIAIDAYRARALTRVARETKSQALEADALHFSSDILSSGVVLVGLALVWLGWPKGDAVAAIGVSAFVCLAGWRLGRRTIDTLIDTAPKGVAERIRAIANSAPGVAGIDRIRVRPAGATLFVDVEIAVSRTHALPRVSSIREGVAARIAKEFPDAELAVRERLVSLDGERTADRVRFVAAECGLAAHRVAVQHLEDRTTVSLSVEVDGRRTLKEAHDRADALEAAIAEELGGAVEVEIHIEPTPLEERGAVDVPPAELSKIVAVAEGLARAHRAIIDVHNVRARRSSEGLFVVLHCRLAPDQSVAQAHAVVDEFEHSLLRRFADARRVVIHAEPPKPVRGIVTLTIAANGSHNFLSHGLLDAPRNNLLGQSDQHILA